MGEFVRLEVDEASRVGTIRLDRPPVNALNAQVQEELLEAAKAAGQDERVGAVVLWGGEKVFAAGADIKEMRGRGFAEMSTRTTDLADAFGEDLPELDNAFPYDSAPVQQAVRGLATALGQALDAPPGDRNRALKKVVSARDTLRGLLSAADYRYFEFQLWQEGVARFIEYAAARAAAGRARRHRPRGQVRGGVAGTGRLGDRGLPDSGRPPYAVRPRPRPRAGGTMTLPRTADVVIVGAGIGGLGAARELAARGVRNIVVLERLYAGAGARDRSRGRAVRR